MQRQPTLSTASPLATKVSMVTSYSPYWSPWSNVEVSVHMTTLQFDRQKGNDLGGPKKKIEYYNFIVYLRQC